MLFMEYCIMNLYKEVHFVIHHACNWILLQFSRLLFPLEIFCETFHLKNSSFKEPILGVYKLHEGNEYTYTFNVDPVFWCRDNIDAYWILFIWYSFLIFLLYLVLLLAYKVPYKSGILKKLMFYLFIFIRYQY